MCSKAAISNWILAFALVCLAACDGGEEARALERIERLAFVPAGRSVLLPATSPVDCSTPEPLLVDRFEVTREEWKRWIGKLPKGDPALSSLEFWDDPDVELHPATGMTLGEARAFADDQGMRLPTAREWIRIAVGTRCQYYPWGHKPAVLAANTDDLNLGRLTPVGTFEAGSTPLGVYDLHGNAAEWVEEPIVHVTVPEEKGVNDTRTWAMGGSFHSRTRATYEFDDPGGTVAYNALLLDPRTRDAEVGLRLVAEAEAWLREESRRWSDDHATRERLECVGRRWGRSAAPLLRRLVEEDGAAPGLQSLLDGAEA